MGKEISDVVEKKKTVKKINTLTVGLNARRNQLGPFSGLGSYYERQRGQKMTDSRAYRKKGSYISE